MIVRLGSIVKITYNADWGIEGCQTGILTSYRPDGWLGILYLTPNSGASYVDPNHNVGATGWWYIVNCLKFFDVEVLEEGNGDKITLLNEEMSYDR